MLRTRWLGGWTVMLMLAGCGGDIEQGARTPSSGGGKADELGGKVANPTITVSVRGTAMEKAVGIGSSPGEGEGCIVHKVNGACPSVDYVLAHQQDEFSYLQQTNCLKDPAKWLPMTDGWTDTPAVFGTTMYDYRSFECRRANDDALNDPSRFVKVFPAAWYEKRPAPTLRIDRCNCENGGACKNSCLDNCARQGINLMQLGYAYRTDNCFPVQTQFNDWWRFDYLCNPGRLTKLDDVMKADDGTPLTGQQAWLKYLPIPFEMEYLMGQYPMDFMPVSPAWIAQNPRFNEDTFHHCAGMVFYRFDMSMNGKTMKVEETVPELQMVATFAGGDEALKPKTGKAVMQFVFQKIGCTNMANPNFQGVCFEEKRFDGLLQRNVIGNAQGDILLHDSASQATFWGAEYKIGSDTYGPLYKSATPVKAYPAHGRWVAVSNTITGWDLANNEASSYFDAVAVDGELIDFPNQKIRIMKPF